MQFGGNCTIINTLASRKVGFVGYVLTQRIAYALSTHLTLLSPRPEEILEQAVSLHVLSTQNVIQKSGSQLLVYLSIHFLFSSGVWGRSKLRLSCCELVLTTRYASHRRRR